MVVLYSTYFLYLFANLIPEPLMQYKFAQILSHLLTTTIGLNVCIAIMMTV